MSIIQTIRDKAAPIVFGAIALSLIAFVLQDGCRDDRGYFNTGDRTIGSINGISVDETEYNSILSAMEADFSKQSGGNVTDQERKQAYDQAWSYYKLFYTLKNELEKIGIVWNSKIKGEYLYGDRRSNELNELGVSQQGGGYDPRLAKRNLEAVLKLPANNPNRIKYEYQIFLQELRFYYSTYTSVLSAAATLPKWLAEKETAENTNYANVKYVMVPYSVIPDSTIQISDKDINDYVQAHKDRNEFKQDAYRSISYVVFDASPKQVDSIALFTKMQKLKPQLEVDTNVQTFFSINQADIQYTDQYNAKSKIQTPYKDSVFALNKGQVYGPYLDGNYYTMAKLIDTKQMCDSVKVRHILIATTQIDPNTGQKSTILSDSVAEKRIDSIIAAIKGGARFDSLAKQFSDDKGGADGGSANNGGILKMQRGNDYLTNQPQFSEYLTPADGFVTNFRDYIFVEGRTGQSKKVKTEYGYHFIEILDQKKFQPYYNIAYFSKMIQSGKETINNASVAAVNFISQATDKKMFDSTAKKLNIPVGIAEIKENDFGLPAIGLNRSFVRSVYKTEKNKTLESAIEFTNQNSIKFVVAIVTDIKEEGVKDATAARLYVEPVLKSKKKAQMIVSKIGNNNNLESVAALYSGLQVETADTISFLQPSKLQNRAAGAVFNKANLNKVTAPVVCEFGVYVLQPLQVFTKPSTSSLADYMKQQEGAIKNAMNGYDPSTGAIGVLINKAKVKDKRMKLETGS